MIEPMQLFPISISENLADGAQATLLEGDTLEVLKKMPAGSVNLVVTSPPYNIGKEYETPVELEHYLDWLRPIIAELFRVLHDNGNVAWQVGNFIDDGEVFPLDIWFYPIFKALGFKLRNRIVWTFDHGLHATHRLSGRYETMLWFSKGDEYTWNLDPIRVPSKYPGKRSFKPGPGYGKPSCNPLGKNPSDIWKLMIHEWETGLWDIPNVKSNHPEKTLHPCSFPIELVERVVLSMTNEGDVVLDPFAGVGSAMLAALKRNRRTVGIDKERKYLDEARNRIAMLASGTLPYRTLGKPVHVPTGKEKVSQMPEEWKSQPSSQNSCASPDPILFATDALSSNKSTGHC
jgi:adenine-specific DNA-methyltransferase